MANNLRGSGVFSKKVLFVSNNYPAKMTNTNQGLIWSIQSFLGNIKKYQITDAHELTDAIKHLQEQDFDLIVLENKIKNQSSISFLNRLRSGDIDIEKEKKEIKAAVFGKNLKEQPDLPFNNTELMTESNWVEKIKEL